MAEARNARLVSGEIMAAAPAGDALPCREPHFDFVDAEFVTLGRTADAAAVATPATPARAEASAAGGMHMLRSERPARAPFGSARGGPLFWMAGFGLVAAAFWFSGGHALMPAGSFNPMQAAVQPLRIASVVSRVDTSGQRAMLNIDGEAINDGADPLPMPPMNIQVVAHDGATTRYNLGTSGSPVAPGEKFAFASRLPVPKNGVKSVSVTFGR
ncbi:hypothetical protein SAMN04488498_102412 [Mesorhizobium albiziae]|uniref:Transmembrane protein n=1 Tax=Neomesorhizobium albiziae TaxID=335020 RepID=A0A1I3WT44_9HYPH|nr:hypothetical protein [Mesorhizobium albiziae]GLS31809.1 hypothetical protein GCM10007937_35190 [Mesorhizobium albiziae]SFK09621.1 hypothetical protein SAMN04488498_102412 [Mesorhizobium albiziae]